MATSAQNSLMPLRRVISDSDILPSISASFTSPGPGTETHPTIVPSLTSLSLDASIVTSSSASTTQPASIGEEQTFTYKPLDTSVDSIRLLILRGATSQESALSCSLLHTNFTEIPHYEALSYEWGSPMFTRSLQVNGANLRIGENLYEALVHIRRAKDCILWIDAICINQNDLAERQYQVGLMDSIYHRAERVLVWLGVPTPDLMTEDEQGTLLVPYKTHSEKFCTWSCEHTYWKRVWIVQEIAQARNIVVYIGKYHMSWIAYLDALKKNRSFKHRGGKIRKLDEKRRGRHGPANRLEQLLEDFQHAQCRETRDKIYGFLGLAHDCPPELRADYSKSTFDIHAEVLDTFSRPRNLPNGQKNTVDRMMRVVRYSQLVQRLLAPEVPYGPSSDGSKVYQSQSIMARGAMTHRIIHLGPARDRIVASIAAHKQWRQSFATYFSLPQDVQLLLEANEAYFPVIKEMDGQTTRKYRALDPQKMYSRGIIAARFWANNESSWSNLEIDKAEQGKIIEKELGKDVVRAIMRAVTAAEELEATSLPSEGTASRSRLRRVTRYSSISRSRSRSVSRRSRRRRYSSSSRSRSRSESLSKGYRPRSRESRPFREFLSDPSKRSEFKSGISKEFSTARSRTRSQEMRKIRGPSPSILRGRDPANDISMISFSESPRKPHEPRLFLGDNGIIGLAPHEAELGDIICQFWGTDVTALLREEPRSHSPPNEALVVDEAPGKKVPGKEAPVESEIGNLVSRGTDSDAVESEVKESWSLEPEGTEAERRQPAAVEYDEPIYRIIGRVHLSTEYLKDLEPTYRKFNKSPDGSTCIDIAMSIYTLAHLTS
jgi:hypothetical protein